MARLNRSIKVTTGLPDVVINMIMCLLSSRLAARSLIVCKDWARIWSSVTVLNFEEDDDDEHQPGQTDRVRRKNFINFLRRCLKCRDKVMSMEKLRLRMTFLGGEKLINKWMSFALQRNVKELDISFEKPPMCKRRCRQYSFPWAVFSLATSLTTLKLDSMTFKDNLQPISLPCLKTLALSKVKLMSNLAFTHLISGCPSLETLSLANLTLSKRWEIKLTNSTLKSLKIFNCCMKIVVEAPNLVSFSLIGLRYDFMQMSNRNVTITSCPKMKILEFVRTNFPCEWFEGLDARFPLLESLSLHHCRPLSSFKVVSQTLQRFSYSDICWSEAPFSLKAPNLKEATIAQEEWYNVSIMFPFFPIQWLIGNFDSCEKMNLHILNDSGYMYPENIICRPPLPRVRHLRLEINTPATDEQVELEECLRWMAPLLESLSITHK